MQASGDCFLKQDLVNKRILAKERPSPCPHELLGPFDLYRSENTEAYISRREQFERVVSEMREQNHNVLIKGCARNETSQCENEPDISAINDRPYQESTLLRKRSERHIHEVTVLDVGVCCVERWFVRHLFLNKFIRAARSVIIKNRLSKRLELLKAVNRETVETLEQSHLKYENVSYPSLFEKFI